MLWFCLGFVKGLPAIGVCLALRMSTVWVCEAKHCVVKADCFCVIEASYWVADAMVRPRRGKATAMRTRSSWVQNGARAASPTQWVDVAEANHLRPRPNGYLDGPRLGLPQQPQAGGSCWFRRQIESIAVMGNL